MRYLESCIITSLTITSVPLRLTLASRKSVSQARTVRFLVSFFLRGGRPGRDRRDVSSRLVL